MSSIELTLCIAISLGIIYYVIVRDENKKMLLALTMGEWDIIANPHQNPYAYGYQNFFADFPTSGRLT